MSPRKSDQKTNKRKKTASKRRVKQSSKKRTTKKMKSKRKVSKRKPKKKTVSKKIRPQKDFPLEITQVSIYPVDRDLDESTRLLAEASVTFNNVLTVSGISIVSPRENKGETLEAGIAPPLSSTIDDEVFEVIKFIDSKDPDKSPMWNYVIDMVSEAFAKEFKLQREM